MSENVGGPNEMSKKCRTNVRNMLVDQMRSRKNVQQMLENVEDANEMSKQCQKDIMENVSGPINFIHSPLILHTSP